MKSIINIIKTTIYGGILFLLPLVLVIMIIEKAFKLSHAIISPIAAHFENKDVAGIPFHNLLSIAALILLCLLAGLIGRTAFAKKMIAAIENNVLSLIPGYRFIKGMGEQMAGIENNGQWKPVIVKLDDNWQLGFLTDKGQDNIRTVFVPDAPKPWSGMLLFIAAERIIPLNITQKDAINYIRSLGDGMQELIKENVKTG
jgi:uncharacterized membrane protein